MPKLIRLFFLAFFIFLATVGLAQNTNIHYRNLQQASPMIRVELHHNDNCALGAQFAGVTIQNLTGYKLRVELEYYCDMFCGERLSQKIGFGDGVVIMPNEHFGGEGFWETKNEAFDAGNRAGSACKSVKIDEHKYSKIKTMGYRLINIENLTEKERLKAEAEEKAAADRKAAADKLAAERKAAAEKAAADRAA